jgi:protein transport protein SEC61 subunit alpha
MLTILAVSALAVRIGLLDLSSGKYVPFLAVLQLFGSGMVVYFLDQVLDKYGISSAVSLFIASNVCETILWQAFSPVTVNMGRGPEFEGALLCLIHLWYSWANKTRAVEEALFRQSLPNLMTLAVTVFVFVAIIYLQGISSHDG